MPRTTIIINWQEPVVHGTHTRIQDSLRQVLGDFQDFRIILESDSELEDKDPLLADLDATYEILQTTRDEIHDAFHDLINWARPQDMLDAIRDHTSLAEAEKIIREVLDPRDNLDLAPQEES